MRSTQKIALFLALVAILAAAVWLGRPTGPEASYGMFEWQEEALADPQSALSLAKQLQVGRWYQELPEQIDRTATQNFVQALSRQGITTYALVGASDWGFEADGASLLAALEGLADYNVAAQPAQQLTGVMVDVEPYTRERWKEDPEAAFRLYLSCMQKAYQYAQKRGLVFIACIPRHYDDQGLTPMLEQLVAGACDEVAVMDYDCGNEAAAIATEARLAAQYSKPLHCILEFQEVGKHGLTENKTYRNKGIAAAQQAWRQVENTCPGQPVVRDYHWTQPLRQMLAE